MTYELSSDQYYFANEVKTKKGNMRPRLWRWGGGDQLALRINFPGLKELKNIEGMAFVQHKTGRFLLLVCDDGDKKKKRGAGYALVRVDQLQVEKK
jgi:hypothetical protein